MKSKTFLKNVTDNLNYLADEECPMFYIKGVVSTRLINIVKSRTEDNCFYSCATPDGYSGIVLAGLVDEYAFTGEPLSIGGESPESQGRAYLKNDEQSKKEAESFFKNSLNRPMHEKLASQPYSPLISLMTADYLLTAKDLLDKTDVYPLIDYENLIRKCFIELANNYGESSLLYRELSIVRKIAEQHDLINLFNLLSRSKIKIGNKPNYLGSVITPRSIIFEGNALEINNIFDAALASKNIYNIYKKSNVKAIFRVFLRTINVYLKSKKYKVEKFPIIVE